MADAVRVNVWFVGIVAQYLTLATISEDVPNAFMLLFVLNVVSMTRTRTANWTERWQTLSGLMSDLYASWPNTWPLPLFQKVYQMPSCYCLSCMLLVWQEHIQPTGSNDGNAVRVNVWFVSVVAQHLTFATISEGVPNVFMLLFVPHAVTWRHLVHLLK